MSSEGSMTHPDPAGNDQPTSTTLIRGARENRNGAWSELVTSYSPIIYNHARGLGLSPEEAADVTQDVLAAAFVSIQRFQREKATDGFRKWLKGITRNKTRELFRQQRLSPGAGVGGVKPTSGYCKWERSRKNPLSCLRTAILLCRCGGL